MTIITKTIAVLVLALLAGCTTIEHGRVSEQPAPPVDTSVYRLQPGDLTDIRFYYNDALSDSVRIRPDGRISLQLVGDIQAAGLTPEELRSVLSERYAPYQRNLDIAVIVREFAGQMVYVGGEVNRPGPVETFGSLTAMRAILAVGGATGTAEMRTVVVLREQPGQEPLFVTLDLQETLRGGSGSDMLLQPFDVVFVPRSQVAQLNQFVDQYIRKLLPFSLNVGFSWIKDIDGTDGSQLP